MRNLNLKLAGVFAFSLLSISAFSQTNWRKGGNNSLPAGSQPTIGTDATWNAPLNFVTNGVQRTRLNGSLVTNLNGVTSHDVSGYFGIAPNGYFATNTPWSMLHLDGDNNTPYSGNGWRKWMKTGVYMGTSKNSL
jgi:hypothetical protein